MRFTGRDAEVALAPPGHTPEFDAWRWAPVGELVDLVVPFKRAVYRQVVEEFRGLIRPT
jgi:putative (di)nucleoside polyphosphate hydrolase